MNKIILDCFINKILQLVILISLTGCVDKRIEEFDLTIVLVDKINTTNSNSLPESIIELMYPLEKCSEVNFIQKVKLLRLDSDKSEIDLKVDRKSFSGNPDNIKLIRRKIDKNVKDLIIDKRFLHDNSSEYNKSSELNNYLQLKSNKSMIYYFSNDKPMNESNNSFKIYFKIDSLKNAINDYLCHEKDHQDILIIIDPPLKQTDVPIETDFDDDTQMVNQNYKQIEDIMNNIGTQKFSFEQRLDLIEPTLRNLFANKSVVRIVGNQGTLVNTQTAEQYLRSLGGYVTMDKLKILEMRKDENNKIYLLIVKEFHPSNTNMR